MYASKNYEPHLKIQIRRAIDSLVQGRQVPVPKRFLGLQGLVGLVQQLPVLVALEARQVEHDVGEAGLARDHDLFGRVVRDLEEQPLLELLRRAWQVLDGYGRLLLGLDAALWWHDDRRVRLDELTVVGVEADHAVVDDNFSQISDLNKWGRKKVLEIKVNPCYSSQSKNQFFLNS